MTQTFTVEGMTCGGCEGSVVRIASDIPNLSNLKADRTINSLTFNTPQRISLIEIQNIFANFPKYSISETISEIIDETEDSTWNVYKPLFIIFALISIVAFITAFEHRNFTSSAFSIIAFLEHFMAGFFFIFSFFKLLDIKAFANSFAMYDIIAERSKFYALAYPFIELAIGLSCLIFMGQAWVYIVDILIMSIGIIGVIRSNLNKTKIQCACLGTVFKLPMSKITIIENGIMIGVGLLLLILN